MITSLAANAMALYGALAQKLDQQHAETMARIEALPCKAPVCPGTEESD